MTTLNYTTDPEYAAPSAADGVSLTPNGTAWADSAWVEIDPSIADDWVLGHIAYSTASTDVLFEIGIGTGGAGSETEVATLAAHSGFNSFNGIGAVDFPAPYGPISAGTRVSVRLRKAGTDTNAWTFSLGYYKSPLAGHAVITSIGPQVWPPAAAGVSVTPSGSAWADSSWVELIASTSASTAFGAIVAYPGTEATTDAYAELDIGTGTAGNEVVKTTLALTPSGDFWGMGPSVTMLRPMFMGFGTGVRVAVRMRKQGTDTTAWLFKAIGYVGFNKTELITARPQVCYPAAADPTQLTVPTPITWTAGAWTELDASLATAIAITGISCHVSNGVEGDIDIGYGSAGNEVVATTFRVDTNQEDGVFLLHYARNIPSGSRLAVRAFGPDTTTTFNVKVLAVTSPDFTHRVDTTQDVWPDRAGSVKVACNTASWGNSGWAEIISSVPSDAVITGIELDSIFGTDSEVDIGFGGAGSETVATTYRFFGEGNATSHSPYRLLPIPLFVAAGTRVSYRARRSGSGSTQNWAVALTHTAAVITPIIAGLAINDISRNFRQRTLNISMSTAGISTLSCEIVSTTGTYRPTLGQEVKFRFLGTLEFCGPITNVRETGVDELALTPISTRIDCQGNDTYATRVYVNTSRPAESLEDRLTYLVSLLASYGITLDVASVSPAQTVEATVYNYQRLDSVLNDLSALTGYVHEIDVDKILRMYLPGTTAAPYDVVSGDGHALGDITVEPTRNEYANRVIATQDAKAVADYTESWTGDGSTNSFELATVTTEAQTRGLVTYNGVDQTLSNPGGGGSWEMDDTVRPITITRAAGAPALGSTITLVVFTGTLQLTATAEDTAEQATNGLWEYVTMRPEVTTQVEMQAIADAELARRILTLKRVTYTTSEAGGRPGYTQTITHSLRNLSGTYTIVDVNIRDEPTIGTAYRLRRTITAIEGSDLQGGDWREFYQQLTGVAA